MANDVVTFPCKYLVFHSGYEYNLTTQEFIEEFKNFCYDLHVVPLYYYNKINSESIKQIQHAIIQINKELTFEDTSVLDRLVINKIPKSMIIKTDTFNRASNTFLKMDSLNYCAMGKIKEIKFISNREGLIDIVYVDVDAEAG